METISKTKKMILAALMLTLSIVLSRFLSIKTPIITISLNFVPILLSAVWLGPKYTAIIYGLSDLIGALLFPFGEYFVGFTISAVLSGLIYGLILYKKNNEYSKKELIIRLTVSTIAVTIAISLILSTIWLVMMYDKAFWVVFSTRAIKELIMLPIQVITMFILLQALKPITKKYLF